MKSKTGICIKCGKIMVNGAGCTHESCGGFIYGIPHKFKMNPETNNCRCCNQPSWLTAEHGFRIHL